MPSAIRLGPSLQTSEGKRERRARCEPTTIRNQSKFDRPPMPHVTVRTYKAVSRVCAYPSEGGSGVRALRITAVEWFAKIAVKWTDLCDPMRVSDLEVLVAAALTVDAKEIHVPLRKSEFRQSKYQNLFRSEVERLGETDKILFKSILGPSHRPLYEQERALKKALILYQWISSTPTKEIEQAHQIFSGAIKKMGEEFSWLIEAISTLAKAEGWPEPVVKKMELLGQRITFGVDAKGVELAKMRIRGLGRGYISRLVQNGFDNPNALGEVPIDDLEKIIPQELAHRIARKFSRSVAPVAVARPAKSLPTKSVQREIQESVNKAVLFVDQKHPGTVEYRGKSVKLTSKQFWLLSALAESPGKCVPYNTIYEKVWGNDVLVEMQQISYHKAQLLKKIQKTAPKAEVKSLITPVSGEGMVLNLRPEEIVRGRKESAPKIT